jgi:hypothetical protein
MAVADFGFSPSAYLYVRGGDGKWVPFGGTMRSWTLQADAPVRRVQQIGRPDRLMRMGIGTCNLSVELMHSTEIPLAPLFSAHAQAAEIVIRAEPPNQPGEMIELVGYVQQVTSAVNPNFVTSVVDFAGQLTEGTISASERARTLADVRVFFERMRSRPAAAGIERVEVVQETPTAPATIVSEVRIEDASRRRIEFEDED